MKKTNMNTIISVGFAVIYGKSCKYCNNFNVKEYYRGCESYVFGLVHNVSLLKFNAGKSASYVSKN